MSPWPPLAAAAAENGHRPLQKKGEAAMPLWATNII